MRILIVEDDKKVAGFLKKGLKEEHYAVDVCYDGEEALFQSQVNQYDLMILDVMLPKKNGFAICKQIREEGNLTPILMLTAKDQLEDKIKGLQEGADDYLTKPFAFEELLARIKALLRRSQDYKTKTMKGKKCQANFFFPIFLFLFPYFPISPISRLSHIFSILNLQSTEKFLRENMRWQRW